MSAENAIVILTLSNTDHYGLEYYVGHCGNMQEMRYAEGVLEFTNSPHIQKYNYPDAEAAIEYAKWLDREYQRTEHGVVTLSTYNLFTPEDLRKYVYADHSNNAG